MGDRLTCFVTFAAPVDLTHVEVAFNIQDANGGNLVLRESRRVGPKTYEVSGPVSDCRPGKYALADVTAARGTAFRLYQGGYGLKSDITLEVQSTPVKQEPRVIPRRVKKGFQTGTMQSPQAGPSESQAFPRLDRVEGSPSSTNAFAATLAIEQLFRKHQCSGTHRPGDRLSCRLQFGSAIELSSLSILLDMDDRDRTIPYYQRPEDQRGLCTSFVFDQYRKIGTRTYEVDGVLPACSSGRYFLSEITAWTACDGEVHCRNRTYAIPTDIRTTPTFRLKNSHQTLFPGLSGVSAKAGL